MFSSDLYSLSCFFRLLNKKFEDLSDAKLPELASELIKTIAKAGVQPQLIPEEGEYLYESINNFIKAIEKRGI